MVWGHSYIVNIWEYVTVYPNKMADRSKPSVWFFVAEGCRGWQMEEQQKGNVEQLLMAKHKTKFCVSFCWLIHDATEIFVLHQALKRVITWKSYFTCFFYRWIIVFHPYSTMLTNTENQSFINVFKICINCIKIMIKFESKPLLSILFIVSSFQTLSYN